jgi:methionyl-tRNA formyltransferase
MMGTGTFAEPTLEALLNGPDPVVGVFTQPDREPGARTGATRQVGRGIKEIAQERGVPVWQPANINSPEGIALLREVKPDLLVVAAYGQILSKEVLSVPALGGINVHASLLPKYRGAAPIAWAIYHGEKQTGVTIIRMSPSLDAGEMLAQEAVDIGPEETAGELESRLAPLGARLALQVIEKLRHGPVTGMKQDRALVTKAPKLKKEDGLIDWTKPAEQVSNQIRAMQPWPTAYTYLHRESKPPQRVIINRANPFPVRYDPTVPPGTMFDDQHFPGSLFVTAGLLDAEERTVVEVGELQPAGKKRMSAAEFLRGHPLREGDHFGPEEKS